jgi:hypothetical protein
MRLSEYVRHKKTAFIDAVFSKFTKIRFKFTKKNSNFTNFTKITREGCALW